MKDVFIINSMASKKAKYEWMKEIKEHFQGRRIIIEKTKEPGHATHIAKKYALQKDEEIRMFVCGGDGTLHEVVNGIAGCKHIKMAIIPIGTGNDFIKTFHGLTKADFLNLENYEDPIEMPCDLLKIDGEYALNTISFGFDVHVAQYANAMNRKLPFHGIVPYYLGMLKALSKPLGDSYRLQMDDQIIPEHSYTFLVAANGCCYGGGYTPCPKADIQDGWMDVCLIGQAKRHEIVKMAKSYEKGELADLMPERVHVQKAKVFHVDTQNQSIGANLDGEVKYFKNPTIEIIPQAIQLLIPKM